MEIRNLLKMSLYIKKGKAFIKGEKGKVVCKNRVDCLELQRGQVMEKKKEEDT